ncbi:hypothetical protein CC1G_13221 [Coprinopsis cinerea okayama7|uniref:Vps72/YL1 C-terminal domain-containing protein n=1 Tax=Coprinopsis cinerea (strain Okayama-7 / 130 / ATCC MYA-4618 / FGSC 9003) TaxID=240176 RepID=A8N0X2_COPC7|nr:hypothetical protein CC1G_13221 [Coprinopsis cinerea okayama7\|eukprot:XP_001828521.2 hypothetical protein CC1G_13221 [Coprinopsis cinerea okayama7\
MDEHDEPLQLLGTGRSRRSTAGNRFQAVMAEAKAEQPKEPEAAEEDKEFQLPKPVQEEDYIDEQNENVDSDFERTFSGEEEEDEDIEGDENDQSTRPSAAEKAIQDEDKRLRQNAKSRLEKATAIAHARNRVTFNPELYASEITGSSSSKLKAKAKENEERDASVSLADEFGGLYKRQSTRTTTILKSSATYERLKQKESKKVPRRKRSSTSTPLPTQSELIAKALDNEEGNIIEHRDYLRNEERKRRKARKVERVRVTGPALRWVSRIEEIEKNEENDQEKSGGKDESASLAADGKPEQPLAPTSKETQRIRTNYLVHRERRPDWLDTMEAVFGDHVDWDKVKVYVGKGRPTSRPIQMCPMTGDVAKYRDPVSGVPYANAEAYKVLPKVLDHQFGWRPEVGIYTGDDGDSDLDTYL